MRPVYVVIVNYQNWRDTLECLQSVFRSSYANYKVFVVDNASTNDSMQQLKARTFPIENFPAQLAFAEIAENDFDAMVNVGELPQLVFVQHKQNNGFAAGNNAVLKRLKEEDAYVWLLNPDMIIERNAMRELVLFAEEKKEKSIIGSVIKFHREPGKIYSYGGAKINFNSATVDYVTRPENHEAIDFISGGALFTHAKSFTDIGLLPEDYFLYWEETDWCYRARRNGYKLLVCPAAICYDKISTTIGKSFMADYYYTRNGLLFMSKYKKQQVPLVLLMTTFRVLKRMFSGQWKRSYGVFKGMLAFLKRRNEYQ